MNDFQTKLMKALSHLHPSGFDGFNLEAAIPPESYQAYTVALLPGETVLTQTAINNAADAWDAAAPERERQKLFLTIPQFRKVLVKTNIAQGGNAVTLKAAVEAAIAAIEDPDLKLDVEIWYENPPAQIRRTAEKIELIRAALGITPEAADEIFTTGMGYE